MDLPPNLATNAFGATTDAAPNVTSTVNGQPASPGIGKRLRLWSWTLVGRQNNTGALYAELLAAAGLVDFISAPAKHGQQHLFLGGLRLAANTAVNIGIRSDVASQDFSCSVQYTTEDVP